MKGSNYPGDSLLETDGLPSYDYATAQPPTEEYQAGPSTSTTTATPAAVVPVPKNSLHLFNGPPNAEPLFGRIETTLGALGDIVTSTKGSTTETRDPKLGNGMSAVTCQEGYTVLTCQLILCMTSFDIDLRRSQGSKCNARDRIGFITSTIIEYSRTDHRWRNVKDKVNLSSISTST